MKTCKRSAVRWSKGLKTQRKPCNQSLAMQRMLWKMPKARGDMINVGLPRTSLKFLWSFQLGILEIPQAKHYNSLNVTEQKHREEFCGI